MERPVDFLIGGVQKGGTTALHEYFRRNLPVSLAHVKEVHYFDDDDQPWSAPDHAAYHAQFDAFDGRPRGEATPIYIYWPNALERIAAYNPTVRLIFLLRDPVARAWSHWRMEAARNFDDAPFHWAIREGRARLSQADPPGFHRVFSYVERGFYADQIARVLRLFPAEQVLILKSEDLKRDPAAVLRRAARHIGVDEPFGAIAPITANAAEGDSRARMASADAAYLQELYRPDVDRLTGLCDIDVSDWLIR